MDEIKFRYIFRERRTGEVFKRVVSINYIENRLFIPNPFGSWDFEILSRDRFINFLDKNKKEIYERDIVTADWHWLDPHIIKIPKDYYDIEEYRIKNCILVIGNVYDNLELLEE